MLDVERIKKNYVNLLTESGKKLTEQNDILVDLVCTAVALGFEKGFAVGRGVKE